MAKTLVRVPALQTVITLSKAVNVELLDESRNHGALKTLSVEYQELLVRIEAYSEETKKLNDQYYAEIRKIVGSDRIPDFWEREKNPELRALYDKLREDCEKARKKHNIPDRYRDPRSYQVTLPKGDYRIDRIYIRKSCKDFDSITVVNVKDKFRFWLKLDVFNSLGFTYKEV